jgi:hypothetical protein
VAFLVKGHGIFFLDYWELIYTIRNPTADRDLKTGAKDDVTLLAFVGLEIGAIHRHAALAATKSKGA